MSSAAPLTTKPFHYDETLHPDGTLLSGWQAMLAHIEGLSAEQRARRQRDIVRQLRVNGVAYHPENAPTDARRSRTLDLVPMLFERDAWRQLASALNQRARLKQALYQDIYGPQQMLAQGLLPAAMLYSHPGYLRDLVDPQASAAPDTALPMFSCDISRGSNGSWQVVDDICQYPAGIGYALENRIVLSRVLPNTFRKYRVRRVVTYFRQLQAVIQASYNNPVRCVLLSYPPSHPHYFEFAWLSRYLGYTLVEPADLTVRDNRVFIKTVTGLQAVDIILRFIDDTGLDPMVIGNRDSGGVPGLVEAARRGGVKVLNPMGAGVLDNPAFNTVLPALCEALLGETLQLPSPVSYWLGADAQRAAALEQIDNLLWRRIESNSPLHDPSSMSAEQRAQLLDSIQLTPASWVAQQRLDRSIAPGYNGAQKVWNQVTIRTYQVAAADGGFEVMPGGLCLLDNHTAAAELDGLAGSKDVWVLSNDPVQEDSLLQPPDQVAYALQDAELPSRIAESVFWLGRNAERVEGVLRLLRCILQSLLDEDRPLEISLTTPAMQGLLRSVTAATGTFPGFSGRGGKKRILQPDRELISLLQDANRTGTLAHSLKLWQWSASSVSDRLASEQLRVFSRLDELQGTLQALSLPSNLCADKEALNNVVEVLDELLLVTSASIGLEHENVTHGDIWLFMMLGRRIERAHQIAVTVAAVMFVDRNNLRLLEYLLRLFDSVMTYRSRYRSGLDNRLVLQLLLLDEINPRSLAYQFKCIQDLIATLPGRRAVAHSDTLNRLAVAGLSRVRLADPSSLLIEERDTRQSLQKFLRVLQDLPTAMADAITALYFTHTESRQTLGHTSASVSGLQPAADPSGAGGRT